MHSYLHLIRFTHCAQAARHTQYRRPTMTIHRAEKHRHSVKNTGFMWCGSSPHSRSEHFTFHLRPPPPNPVQTYSFHHLHDVSAKCSTMLQLPYALLDIIPVCCNHCEQNIRSPLSKASYTYLSMLPVNRGNLV